MVRASWRHEEASSRSPACLFLDRSLSNSPSEIPCRVIELPEPGVILAINRLITGKPSSYAALQGRRTSEWVIPWEVGSSELDPVTTDRPLWT
jgi:hypothetical protein